jgi:hypothetical protein
LYCKLPNIDSCIGRNGAAEGTTCNINGSICIQGVCTKNQIENIDDNCLYGDDLVTKNLVGFPLPYAYMACPTFLDYVSNIRNESPLSYCTNEYLGKSNERFNSV